MIASWKVLLAAAALAGPLAQPPRIAAQQAGPGGQRQADSAQTAGQAATPATPADPAAPVVLGRDTLIWIRTRVGSFRPAERAQAIARRLSEAARDGRTGADSTRVVPGDGTADIVLGDRILMTVTAGDAAADSTSVVERAESWAAVFQDALRREGLVSRMRSLAVGTALTLLATVITLLVLRLIRRTFPRIYEGIERGRNAWIPGLRVQKLEIVSSDRLTDAALWVARAARLVILALLLYVSIPIILSFFPWTERYSAQLMGYIVAPFVGVWRAFTDYLPKLFTILAIGVTTWLLLRVIRFFFVAVSHGSITFPGFYQDWAMPTFNLVRALVLVFAFIALWPYLPWSDSPAFKGVGVFIGLLISLGSASAIGNVVGGVVLTYMRPFRVGDRVRIADTVGDVIDKTLLVTRVRTIKNVEVTVPNAMVLGSHIINYSATAAEGGVILHTTVTIGYDAPWRQVHDLLRGAAADTMDVLVEPPPFVLQTGLDDFYVRYELNAYTDRPNRMAGIYSELHQNIQDQFNRAGIEIMSPHYGALRDGNASTIPGAPGRDGAGPGGFRIVRLTEGAPSQDR